MGPSAQDRSRGQHSDQLLPSSSFVQVCDRCRWKKIKCDGARPCVNCRNAKFPCESRARLSKQATPRSYVQYLEARIRQLENQRENEWSPSESGSKQSPYGASRFSTSAPSSDSSHCFRKRAAPDWTTLKELGVHIIDEDGVGRYMGPSSGVGFATNVLRDLTDEDQLSEGDYHSLFALDDFARGKALEEADMLSWQSEPTKLPAREATDRLVALFFTFTERIFPVLHRPTFLQVVDRLYSLDTIELKWFEDLAQLHFVLSIGYCYDARVDDEQRISNQVRAVQVGARCFYTLPHRRKEGLTRLQTLNLYSYALVLLGQHGPAIRVSAMANSKALECGLHQDGNQFHGNPLETEMRRRVFWCIFMIHLFNSSLAGLPRSLHAADITIAEPSDIDDDQLTKTEVLNGVPGRTKIHRFVSVVRLVRILSRTLDVLYTNSKRTQASTRIEQMNRLCCEHLLEQLDFSFDETPDDMPDPDSEDPRDMAILASYANEQTLYHYIRWLVHRPGLAQSYTEPHFAPCLQASTDAASAILKCVDTYKRVCPFIKLNPAVHPCSVFIASLAPLYYTWLLKHEPGATAMLSDASDEHALACQSALDSLEYTSFDHADTVRRRLIQSLVMDTFGEEHEELRRLSSIQSNPPLSIRPSLFRSASRSGQEYRDEEMLNGNMNYHEHQLEHYTAHEDLRTFVHEAFSPGMAGQWPDDHMDAFQAFVR